MGIISLTVTCGLLVASHWRREATKYARWIAFTGSKWSSSDYHSDSEPSASAEAISTFHHPSLSICGDLTFKNVFAACTLQVHMVYFEGRWPKHISIDFRHVT